MPKLPGDLTSTITYENGSTATIVDAWFVHDNVNTYYAGDDTLDVRALFLPALRGFGQLADLHIAMSSDATLGRGFGGRLGFLTLSDPHDQDLFARRLPP